MITAHTWNEIPISNNLRYDCCPLCSSKNIVKVGDIEYLSPLIFSTRKISLELTPELWSCRNCRSAFTQNAIPEEIAENLYECGKGGDRWQTKPFIEAKHKKIIETLDSLFKQNMKVLDIGCNTGELLDYAKSRGCITAGVEFCKASREITEEKGHETFSSLNNDSDSYDIITAFDLVEHLYDVSAFFNYCRQKLSNNGKTVLLTGNISSLSARIAGSNWWYLKYPEHILFISPKHIKSLAGFRSARFIFTYASLEYAQPIASRCIALITGLLRGDYRGLPPLRPDHVLVVLEK